MILKKYLVPAVFMLMTIFNSPSLLAGSTPNDYKNSPNISMYVGKAESNSSNYGDSSYLEFVYSKPVYDSAFNLDLGWKRFTRFEYRSDEDTGVDVRAFSLGVSKEVFKRRRLSVDFALTTLSYNSKTYFLGGQTDSENDFTFGAEIRSSVNFRVVALNLGLEWYRNISSADISVLSLGITFNLGPMFGF